MSIVDIVWPWGALRREREARAAEEAWFLSELERRELRVDEERERADRFSAKVIRLSEENLRFKRLFENAHYRDPVTGRIGKQGKYPL